MQKWIEPEFWQGIFTQTLEWLIHVIPTILLILVFALIGLKLIRIVVKRARGLMELHMKRGEKIDETEMNKRIDTLASIMKSALNIVLWAVVFMLLLRQLGLDIAPLIAGAGIAGLAIGFGAQELVRDFISGFFMLLENQVRAGDVAIVNGTGGLVERVGLRTIVLRDLSGVVHVYQNGKVNTLSNMTKEWSAMVFDIGVAYKEDTDKVMEVMRKVDEDLRADDEFGPSILEPMEIFGVDAFADSAVVIKGRIKTSPIKQWMIGREYRRRLKKAFDELDIEIPFPHQTIYWGAEIDPLKISEPKGG